MLEPTSDILCTDDDKRICVAVGSRSGTMLMIDMRTPNTSIRLSPPSTEKVGVQIRLVYCDHYREVCCFLLYLPQLKCSPYMCFCSFVMICADKEWNPYQRIIFSCSPQICFLSFGFCIVNSPDKPEPWKSGDSCIRLAFDILFVNRFFIFTPIDI